LARTSNQRSLNAAADALQALRDATQETVHRRDDTTSPHQAARRLSKEQVCGFGVERYQPGFRVAVAAIA